MMLTKPGLAALLLLVPVAVLWQTPALASDEAPPLERSTERGPVTATVRIEPRAPRIGDPLLLEIEVRAEPGVELLMPEFGEALDRFAIVDFAPREWLGDDGSAVALQRYTLQSARSGRQSVPPIAIEFVDRRPGREPAPEGEDAYELLTERLEFEVASVLPEDAPLELRPVRDALGPRLRPGALPWGWIAAGLAVLAAVAPFAWRFLREWLARARSRSAFDQAMSELEELLYAPRPGPEQMDAFFVRLSGIVRRYIEARFRILAPELTTEEFLEAMSDSPDLRGPQRELLRPLLQRADLVKFAHFVPETADVETSIGEAQRFLAETGLASEPAHG